MHPYALLVAAACLTSAACAGFTTARAARRPATRLVAAIFLGTAWWALCDLATCLVTSREAALAWIRASAPGWIFLGPLVLHFFAVLADDHRRRTHRLILVFYATEAGFLLLELLGSSMVVDALPTAWGWQGVPGPALPAYYAGTMASATAAFALLRRRLRALGSASERRQRRWVVAAVAAPICVASLTDAILPWLDVPVPRLGSPAFACLGALGVWLTARYGHSVLIPSSLAEEILSALPDGVALVQADRRIHRANPALVRLSGRSREQLEGFALEALFEAPVPEVGSRRELAARLLRPMAASIPVGVGASTLHDRRGNELGQVVVLRDLREVDALRERVVTAARMAAVGELAAGIAHEINNPIAFVRSNLSQLRGHWKTLRSELEATEQAAALGDLVMDGDALIEESLEGVDRAAEIVRGVRGFSHAGSGAREPTDLNRLLDEVLRMMSSRLRGRVTLECNYVELPPVLASPQELKQVFLNLLVNAEHAVADGGRIRVATTRGSDSIGILVEDDGCGIAPELLERVFDPFFTTKPVGVGTGLGLGIAYQIVKGHSGEIRIESQPGVGTRVRVRLPVSGG
jgi:two-component system NtrC family sensor kinase